MTVVFNGRAFAARLEKKLAKKVKALKAKGITPKLVSILVGKDPASSLYLKLKKRTAERIGCELRVEKFSSKVKPSSIIRIIEIFNRRDEVHGIMAQLPLPRKFVNSKFQILNTIAPTKDVDGLRDGSPFVHPSAKAVLEILKYAVRHTSCTIHSVAVVGYKGMVGKSLIKELEKTNYEVRGCDSGTKNLDQKTKDADVIISATGVPNLIKANMVKKGVVIIDVGSPKGDFDPSTALGASFIAPVPGGVGPVTIICLLENLVEAASR